MNAVRRMLRAPRFALFLCVVLGIGIGAGAAIWTTLRAVVADLPPVTEPDSLRIVERTSIDASGQRSTSIWLSYPVYQALRESLGEAGRLAAFTAEPDSYVLGAGDARLRLPVEFVSGNYFGVLGAGAAIGRSLAAGDDVPGAAPVVVLTHATARALYGEADAAVGAALAVDGYPFTVIGVAPRGFAGLSERASAFLPMAAAPGLTFSRRLESPYSSWHQAVLRPEAGVREHPGAVLEAGAARATELYGGDLVRAFEFSTIGLNTAWSDPQTTRMLWVVFGGVLALLLLACANAMNLALMRGTRKAGELALRKALGADDIRLIGGGLAEAAVIAALAAVVAVGVAAAILAALRYAAPNLTLGTVALDALSVDGRLIGAAAVFAFLSVAVALVLPAIVAARGAAPAARNPAVRGTPAATRLRRGLVVVEVTLAMLLLIGGGLMIRSVWNLQQVPPGFEADGVLTTELALPRATYDDAGAQAFFEAALERMRTLPGAGAAAVAYCPPPRGACDHVVATIAGRDGPAAQVVLNQVSADYFRTLNIPLLAGRGFGGVDGPGGAPVVVISQLAAKNLFGGVEHALGRRMQLGVGWPEEGRWAEVIGVAGDVRDAGLASGPRPVVYTDWRQLSYGEGSLLVRASAPETLARPVADAMRTLDPGVVPWRVRPLSDGLRESLARERLTTLLLAGFAAVALLLATSGVFAVLALAVAQRTRELGVRMAVGARKRDLFRAVMTEGGLMVGAGALAGLVASQALGGVLDALLFGVTSLDPSVRAVAFATLSATGLAGAALPALRAARVDPIEALRDE